MSELTTILALYIFLVGLACGSFALVLADRIHSGKDWVRGRSACEQCGHRLVPRDLIPLLSWLANRGRCRYCKAKLSAAYPLVELAVGAAFLISYLQLGANPSNLTIFQLIVWLCSLALLAALFIYDLRWFLLPDKVVFPLVGLSALHWVAEVFVSDDSVTTTTLLAISSLAVSSGLFYGLYVVSKGKWIGFGDVKLGLAIGFLLAQPLEAWLALFAASITGLVYFALTALPKKKPLHQMKVPFGPFLILGLFFAYVWGSGFIGWYSQTFLSL